MTRLSRLCLMTVLVAVGAIEFQQGDAGPDADINVSTDPPSAGENSSLSRSSEAAKNVNEFQHTQAPTSLGSTWTYKGSTGATQWPLLFRGLAGECDGLYQSPINFSTALANNGSNASALADVRQVVQKLRANGTGTTSAILEASDQWASHYNASNASYRAHELLLQYATRKGLGVQNTGHTIRCEGDALTDSRIVFDNESYQLEYFDFHAPSEHVVDDIRAPLEAQLVHRSRSGKVIAVAVLFTNGSDNSFLEQLNWKHLPSKKGAGNGITSDLDLYTLLPPVSHSIGWPEFFQYWGSATTPPCTAGYMWIVLKHRVPVSAAQLAHFPFGHNARPVQPLHGRKIVLNGIAPKPLPSHSEERGHNTVMMFVVVATLFAGMVLVAYNGRLMLARAGYTPIATHPSG